MKNLLTILLLFLVHFVNGESGSIELHVYIIDGGNLANAEITVSQNDTIVEKGQTDSLGMFYLNQAKGIYNIEISKAGHPTKQISGVAILKNETVKLNIDMPESCITIIKVIHNPPLIDMWNTSSRMIIRRKEIQRSPHKN